MSKRIPFGKQPAKKDAPVSADAWVEQRQTAEVKRLTLDIPADLHRRLKQLAASQEVSMVDLLRAWIQEGVDRETANRNP